MNARARNTGWRIDYFIVSARIADNIEEAVIHADVMGSDHCPVELMITL
ncbi:exodeoxyribonuclease III [Listeria rocourtiae FSL F6-920]|nr:exodeoxyribonuclease III [Listeria rocourtiae FSL F6-920]